MGRGGTGETAVRHTWANARSARHMARIFLYFRTFWGKPFSFCLYQILTAFPADSVL